MWSSYLLTFTRHKTDETHKSTNGGVWTVVKAWHRARTDQASYREPVR